MTVLSQHTYRDVADRIRFGPPADWMNRLMRTFPWMTIDLAIELEDRLVKRGDLEEDRRRYGWMHK